MKQLKQWQRHLRKNSEASTGFEPMTSVDLGRFLGCNNVWFFFSKWVHLFNIDSFIFSVISISLKWCRDFTNSLGILKLYYNQKSPKNGLREVRTTYCTQINNTRVEFICYFMFSFPLVRQVQRWDRSCQHSSEKGWVNKTTNQVPLCHDCRLTATYSKCIVPSIHSTPLYIPPPTPKKKEVLSQ